MSVGTIIAVIVGIIILYLIMSWWFDSSTYLSGLRDGKKPLTISSDKLGDGSGHSSNFSYSIWFYINDWNYDFGQRKTVFARGKHPGSGPRVVLDKYENNLLIEMPVYGHNSGGGGSAGPSDGPQPANCDSADCSDASRASNPTSSRSGIHHCNVPNVPIQRWVNLIISVYGRSLDVYLDGKLVRTCVLPNTALVNPKANVHLTPNGGFDGWTSNFQYFIDATNPQEAWNIYQSGYGGSVLGDLFNRYIIRVEFLKDGRPEGSFEI
jgi:hypothetical protein